MLDLLSLEKLLVGRKQELQRCQKNRHIKMFSDRYTELEKNIIPNIIEEIKELKNKKGG